MAKKHSAVYYDQAYSLAVQMRESGIQQKEIAERLDIPVGTIQKWLQNGRKPIKTAEFTPAALTEAWEGFKMGMSYEDVALILGVSNTHTVARYFPGMGWTRDDAREYARFVKKELNRDEYEVRAYGD